VRGDHGCVDGARASLRGGSQADRKQRACAAAQRFIERFEADNGASDCRDLLECDISTADGMKLAVEGGRFKTLCPQLVRSAASILREMLEEQGR
jgi:hypothetical protein